MKLLQIQFPLPNDERRRRRSTIRECHKLEHVVNNLFCTIVCHQLKLAVKRRTVFIAQIPWATSYIRGLIGKLYKNELTIVPISIKMVGQRLKAGSVTKDLFYHLVCVDFRREYSIIQRSLCRASTWRKILIYHT